jgi:hypothetical protein
VIEQILNRDAMTGAVQQLLRSIEYGSLPETPELLTVMAGLQVFAEMSAADLDAEDRKAFIPCQEQVSLLQAVLEELASEGELEVPADQAGQPNLEVEPLKTARLPPLAREQIVVRHADGSTEEGWGDFNLTDAQWATMLAVLVATHRKRRQFRGATADPRTFEMADDARVILVGDWGNGGPDAIQVAGVIRAWLEDAGSRECLSFISATSTTRVLDGRRNDGSSSAGLSSLGNKNVGSRGRLTATTTCTRPARDCSRSS